MPKQKGYTLRGPHGSIEYIGITSDPERRASEHRADGKPGNLHIETGARSPESAAQWEQERLDTYRENHGGKNPPLNKQ